MNGFVKTELDIQNFEITREIVKEWWEPLMKEVYQTFMYFDAWNIVCIFLLVLFLLMQGIRLLRKKKMSIFLNILIILSVVGAIICSCIFTNEGNLIIVEREWGFGETIEVLEYDRSLNVGIETDDFVVKKIEDDGITVEFKKTIYEGEKVRREIIEQKLEWNTNYEIEEAVSPSQLQLCVDGGVESYYRFEK